MSLPVTIVIPSHRRPRYLARALEYYSQAGFPVLVADSSDAPLQGAGDLPGVAYFHKPGVPFLEKVRAIMPLVQTPCMAFCADDDFTVPRAALACAEFLLANPDYSSAQGHYVTATPSPAGMEFSPGYPDNHRVRVESDEPATRLREVFSPYVQNFYAVHRTETWRSFYALPTERIPHYCVLELLGAMLAAILGKHKVLPLFYSVRDHSLDDDRGNPMRRENIDVVMTRPEYADEYETFLASLAAHLGRRSGLDQEQSRAAVQGAVDLFVSGTLRSHRPRPFYKKLPKYAGRALDVLSLGRRQAARVAESARIRGEAFQTFFNMFDSASKEELRDIRTRLDIFGGYQEHQ